MAETVNLPRDSTLRELVAVQKASIIASGNAAAIDRLYGSLVRAAKSVEEVNILFVDWWNADDLRQHNVLHFCGYNFRSHNRIHFHRFSSFMCIIFDSTSIAATCGKQVTAII